MPSSGIHGMQFSHIGGLQPYRLQMLGIGDLGLTCSVKVCSKYWMTEMAALLEVVLTEKQSSIMRGN